MSPIDRKNRDETPDANRPAPLTMEERLNLLDRDVRDLQIALARSNAGQHAGIVLGLNGSSGHLFKGLDAGQPHYLGLDRVVRNTSAVTGACLLVRAGVFREIGGFDEAHFPVHANPPDLCLRIASKGYRVLYTPYAGMDRYESLSKTLIDFVPSSPEYRAFSQRWAESIRNDPFYGPNLTRRDVDCSPRRRGE